MTSHGRPAAHAARSDADPAVTQALVAEGMRSAHGLSMVFFDADTRILAVHGQAAQRHGCIPERVVGRQAADVMSATTWSQLGPLCLRALTGETGVAQATLEDGVRIEASFQPVRRDGVLIGGMLTARDIAPDDDVEAPDRAVFAARDEALAQFETSFVQAPIGMCLVSTAGRLLRVNPALCALLGRTADELQRFGFQQLTHPDDLAADLQLFQECVDGTRSGYELDKRYLRPDGSVVEARLSASLVRDADGRPSHFVSQIVDLSLLLGMQRELASVNLRLKAVLDHSPMAIHVRDLEERWQVANPEMCRVLGIDEGELLGTQLRDTYAGEALSMLQEHDRRVVEAGRAITFDTTLPDARTGDLRHWRASKFPIRDAGGMIVAVGGMTVDVTERERTLRELHETRELFETAFDNAPVGKLLSRQQPDASTVVVKANAAFAEMVGLPADKLVGTAPTALVHPDDHPVRDRMLDDLLAGRPTQGEVRFLHADGHHVWTQVAPAMVRSASGDTLFVLQAMDISERRRFEEQLRRLADQDSLTGLFTRRRFEEELVRETARARRHGGTLSLLLLDLDGFKAVNDTHGHAAGDALLVRVAHTLRSTLREGDVVARLGGDEFAVILPHADGAGALVAAAKLSLAFRARAADARQPGVSASIGVTTTTADGTTDPDELLLHADRAMYRAKAAGRGQIRT